jgi:hypothetical protein
MPWWGYVLIVVGVLAIGYLKLKVFSNIQKRKVEKAEKHKDKLDNED